MEELKLTGNHLKGSRPLLTFSSNFDNNAHWKLIKEVIIQVILFSPLSEVVYIFRNLSNLSHFYETGSHNFIEDLFNQSLLAGFMFNEICVVAEHKSCTIMMLLNLDTNVKSVYCSPSEMSYGILLHCICYMDLQV